MVEADQKQPYFDNKPDSGDFFKRMLPDTKTEFVPGIEQSMMDIAGVVRKYCSIIGQSLPNSLTQRDIAKNLTYNLGIYHNNKQKPPELSAAVCRQAKEIEM